MILTVILAALLAAAAALLILWLRSDRERFKLSRELLKARETAKAALSQRDQAQEELQRVLAQAEHASATHAYLAAVNALPSFGKHAGQEEDDGRPYVRGAPSSSDLLVYPPAPVNRNRARCRRKAS